MERSDHRRRIEAAHTESDEVLRLRRRRGATGAAETVAEARDPARSPGGRESLRAAAVASDGAGARSQDAVGALDLHQALVIGCWSLVDSFERDGKRYLIARPGVPGSVSGLSVRESQVVLFVAMGHALKRIAYELGISQSSVATYLRRGLVKLQLPDRIALTRRFTGFRQKLPDPGDHDDTGA